MPGEEEYTDLKKEGETEGEEPMTIDEGGNPVGRSLTAGQTEATVILANLSAEPRSTDSVPRESRTDSDSTRRLPDGRTQSVPAWQGDYNPLLWLCQQLGQEDIYKQVLTRLKAATDYVSSSLPPDEREQMRRSVEITFHLITGTCGNIQNAIARKNYYSPETHPKSGGKILAIEEEVRNAWNDLLNILKAQGKDTPVTPERLRGDLGDLIKNILRQVEEPRPENPGKQHELNETAAACIWASMPNIGSFFDLDLSEVWQILHDTGLSSIPTQENPEDFFISPEIGTVLQILFARLGHGVDPEQRETGRKDGGRDEEENKSAKERVEEPGETINVESNDPKMEVATLKRTRRSSRQPGRTSSARLRKRYGFEPLIGSHTSLRFAAVDAIRDLLRKETDPIKINRLKAAERAAKLSLSGRPENTIFPRMDTALSGGGLEPEWRHKTMRQIRDMMKDILSGQDKPPDLPSLTKPRLMGSSSAVRAPISKPSAEQAMQNIADLWAECIVRNNLDPGLALEEVEKAIETRTLFLVQRPGTPAALYAALQMHARQELCWTAAFEDFEKLSETPLALNSLQQALAQALEKEEVPSINQDELTIFYKLGYAVSTLADEFSNTVVTDEMRKNVYEYLQDDRYIAVRNRELTPFAIYAIAQLIKAEEQIQNWKMGNHQEFMLLAKVTEAINHTTADSFGPEIKPSIIATLARLGVDIQHAGAKSAVKKAMSRIDPESPAKPSAMGQQGRKITHLPAPPASGNKSVSNSNIEKKPPFPKLQISNQKLVEMLQGGKYQGAEKARIIGALMVRRDNYTDDNPQYMAGRNN